jgi:tyrosine-protein phosphatase YwqE
MRPWDAASLRRFVASDALYKDKRPLKIKEAVNQNKGRVIRPWGEVMS